MQAETFKTLRIGHRVVISFGQHGSAGATPCAARAESTCRRLNAYPAQTRRAFGLL